MRVSRRIAILTTGGLLWVGVQTAAAGTGEFQGKYSAWVPPDNSKCTCRFKGEHLPLGSRRCLQTPQGARTAECVTNQNITSWQPSDEPCPQASLIQPQG